MNESEAVVAAFTTASHSTLFWPEESAVFTAGWVAGRDWQRERNLAASTDEQDET